MLKDVIMHLFKGDVESYKGISFGESPSKNSIKTCPEGEMGGGLLRKGQWG